MRLVLATTLWVAATCALAKDVETPPPGALRVPAVERLAIVGADIHPVTGPAIPDGTLLLEDGRIRALLPSGRSVPSGFRRIEAHGLRAYPGLVAASADGLGLAEDARAGGVEAQMLRSIAESFDPWADAVELAASSGITSALVTRTSAEAPGPFAGRGAVLKMAWRQRDGLVVKEPAALFASAALLTPKGAFQLEQAVAKAREWARTPARKRKPDALSELVVALKRRELPLVVSDDRAPELLTALDIAREHELRMLVLTSDEAWVVADQLAHARVGVMQHVRLTWGKPRADRRSSLPGGWRFDAPARLLRAGVEMAVVPDADTTAMWGVYGRDLLALPMEAAFAQRGGLSPAEALASITIWPARLLGVDDRVGSLAPGKDADVILTDGDLLDYRTLVRMTIVSGRIVYESKDSRWWRGVAERRDRALSRGGLDAGIAGTLPVTDSIVPTLQDEQPESEE